MVHVRRVTSVHAENADDFSGLHEVGHFFEHVVVGLAVESLRLALVEQRVLVVACAEVMLVHDFEHFFAHSEHVVFAQLFLRLETPVAVFEVLERPAADGFVAARRL